MLFEMYVCLVENTLSCGQGKVQMSFWRNWAISIGGFLIFPIINALLIPHLPAYTNFRWGIAFIGGFFITGGVYQFWCNKGEKNKGHILYWRKKRGDHWTKNVTGAGWVNFIFMIVQVTILFAFIFNPMPRQVVVGVGVLLINYFLIINLQVHFIQQDRFNASATFLEMFVVLIITGLKAS
jgi:hypothetical protein